MLWPRLAGIEKNNKDQLSIAVHGHAGYPLGGAVPSREVEAGVKGVATIKTCGR